MSAHLLALCFDANDPLRLARFWSGVLGWEMAEDPHDGVALLPSDDTGFRIRFLATQEQKAGPNQMHFDLTSTSLEDQQQTVARSRSLGARHIDIGQRPEEGHVVLADPEGNEFCVIEPGTASLLTADSSERLRATGRRTSGTSGVKRWAGRWSGTRTRRPRSARPMVVRRSRGAVRH
jgi:predicted enzyme related to lactoylglutathione lyase